MNEKRGTCMQIKINILLCVNILLGCKPPSDKCVFSSPTPHPPSLFLPFFPSRSAIEQYCSLHTFSNYSKFKRLFKRETAIFSNIFQMLYNFMIFISQAAIVPFRFQAIAILILFCISVLFPCISVKLSANDFSYFRFIPYRVAPFTTCPIAPESF